MLWWSFESFKFELEDLSRNCMITKELDWRLRTFSFFFSSDESKYWENQLICSQNRIKRVREKKLKKKKRKAVEMKRKKGTQMVGKTKQSEEDENGQVSFPFYQLFSCLISLLQVLNRKKNNIPHTWFFPFHSHYEFVGETRGQIHLSSTDQSHHFNASLRNTQWINFVHQRVDPGLLKLSSLKDI